DFDVRLRSPPKRTTRDGPAAVRGSPGNRASPGEPGHDRLHAVRAGMPRGLGRPAPARRTAVGRRGEPAGPDRCSSDAAYGTAVDTGARNHFRLVRSCESGVRDTSRWGDGKG